jgi:alkaline phosphatase D
MRFAATVDRRDAPVTTHATWVVEDGRAGAQEA